MEEFLIILIQFIVEVFLQMCFHFPFEYAAWQHDESKSLSGCLLFPASLLIGTSIGGLSVAIAPHLMLPSSALRLANMIVSPLAVGGLSFWLAQGRKNVGHNIVPSRFFWLGFAFSLGFTAIRLAFGSR